MKSKNINFNMQAKSALEIARIDLDRTKVRAPSRGFVTQLNIKVGMMSTHFPLKPLVSFIPDDRGLYLAAFRQVSIGSIEPGYEVELAFNALPGKIFTGKVTKVLPAIAEGQVSATDRLILANYKDEGRYVVLFDLGKDMKNIIYQWVAPFGSGLFS